MVASAMAFSSERGSATWRSIQSRTNCSKRPVEALDRSSSNFTSQCLGLAVIGLSWDTREYVASAMYQEGALDVLAKEQTADEVHRAILSAVASMSDD
jgi:hypothetical protein